MKKIIAGVLLAASFNAHAGSADGDPMNMAVHCWDAQQIIRLVEAKHYSVARYYSASFKSAKGHMAELIDRKERQMVIFVFVGDKACMTAVVDPTNDDMKRAGL